ncbi:MAG: BPSS1780 family membrane protein [Burkholderiaceae bacterium]
MNITPQPAARGLLWLAEGLRLMKRQPLGLFAMTFLSIALTLLPSIIPGIGTLLTLVVQPAIYFGLMTAIKAIDEGEHPNPRLLLAAFKPEESGNVWQPLLVLGTINAALVVCVMLVATLFAADTAPIMISQDQPAPDPELLTQWLQSTLIFAVLFMPVQMAMWYAPLFVGWHGTPAGKSLFFSLVAVWRNKWGFAALFIGWMAILFVLILILNLLVAGLGLAPALLSMMIAPLTLLIISAAYCSFWVNYRDVIR